MLKSVYKGGSSCILPNPNDEDYFYYFENNDERKQALTTNQDFSVDNHYCLWEKRLSVHLGCYTYPFMEHISGEEIVEFKDFNICDHKQEYKELAMKYVDFLKDDSKKWYHILVACYMFENNKMSLTKTQLNKVQKVHDSGITQELKEYCINTLNEIQ